MSEKPILRSKLSSDPIVALKPYLSKKGVRNLKDSETDDRLVSKISSGKVRNMYGFDLVLFETSDRLSVFDRVVSEYVLFKGEMLNCISQHNKEFLENLGIKTDLVDVLMSGNHQIKQVFRFCGFEVGESNRLSFAKKLKMFPLEFIVRGYIVGSAWKAYQRGESYCGFTFPEGLKEGQKLETPILTPTTKASSGHDRPVTREEAVDIITSWLILECSNLFDFKSINDCKLAAERSIDAIYELSLYAYNELAKMAEEKGILFIDTKFEFGLDKNGEICLGDEVGTPDSSRFAPKDVYEETGKIISLDKQIVRDYCSDIGFTGDPNQDIPELPDDLLNKLTATYIYIAELICGKEEVDSYIYT